MTKPIYVQKSFPIFQNRMYGSRDEARHCPRGEIVLAEDPRTGIVCNHAFQPELMIYDQNYQNEQGVSPTFQRHLDEVAQIIERSVGILGLVEIGCGKGYFLETLVSRGVDITGFDPTYEGQNERIRRESFSPKNIDKARGIVLRHVLEHIQNPIGFLRDIAAANAYTGRIYIEVPCFDWICQHKAWFDIFYEHVNYFRLSDFHRWFEQIVESGHLFGGQYLYVVAELSSLRSAPIPSTPVQLPDDFLASIEKIGEKSSGSRVVWGGASKGVIFALLMERSGRPIDIVIDINPAKQGKFLAGTGICVSSPEEALPQLAASTQIYVMNSNYLDEIKNMTQNKYAYIGVEHE